MRRGLFPSFVLVGAILASCDQRPAGPDSLAIKPGSTPFGPSIRVDITGTGFYPLARANFDDEAQSEINTTFRARLGSTELEAVTWKSKTLLEATVPANLQRGTYDLTVIDPLGRSGVKKQAFRVGDPPDGGTADAGDATVDGPGRDAGPDADASQDLQTTDLPLTPDLPIKPDLPLPPDLPLTPDLPLQPDAPLPDAPLPDAPLPDAPLPDAPLPDAPLPDAPWPDAPWPDAPLPDAASPDQSQQPPTGYAAWIESGKDIPRFAIYNGITFPTQGLTAKGAKWRIMAAAEATTRAELILVGVDGGNQISGVYGSYTGGWKTIPYFPLNTNKVAESYWWGMDVAYESVSGDALVVYNNASKNGQLGYATFDGTVWSAKQIATAYTGDEPQQMHLAASPTSDQMVLVVNDKKADHYALVWSGSSFGNQRLLDATGTAESDQTALAAAYEQQSGRAMVVYGKNTKTGGYYRTWNGSAWSSEGTFPGSSGNQVRWFTLAAHAGSNKLIVGALTTGSSNADVWVNVWDGAAFGAATQVESTATGSIYPNVAVAFESTSGQALVVYGQASTSSVRYRTLGTSAIWSAEQLGPNLGQTPNTLLLRSHPTSDKIMLAAQDGGKDVSYVLWSGTGWAAPIQLESDSGETKNQPFEFVWDR